VNPAILQLCFLYLEVAAGIKEVAVLQVAVEECCLFQHKALIADVLFSIGFYALHKLSVAPNVGAWLRVDTPVACAPLVNKTQLTESGEPPRIVAIGFHYPRQLAGLNASLSRVGRCCI
jgi:hypothetical protein